MKQKKFFTGKNYGSIIVQVFKENQTNQTIFYLQSDNESLLPVMEILEDTLKKYKKKKYLFN